VEGPTSPGTASMRMTSERAPRLIAACRLMPMRRKPAFSYAALAEHDPQGRAPVHVGDREEARGTDRLAVAQVVHRERRRLRLAFGGSLTLSSIQVSSDSGVAMPRCSRPKRTSGSLTQRAYVGARSRRSGPSATRSPTTRRSGSGWLSVLMAHTMAHCRRSESTAVRPTEDRTWRTRLAVRSYESPHRIAETSPPQG
jgi:hypothetical protein